MMRKRIAGREKREVAQAEKKRVMDLTNKQHRVRLKIESGWMLCPRCRKKIFKPLPETSGKNLPIYCDNCKITWITSIKKEPDEAR